MESTISNKRVKKIVVLTNDTVEKMLSKIALRQLPELGPEFSVLDSISVQSLVAYRLKKGWCRPDNSIRDALTLDCYAAWSDQENYLWSINPHQRAFAARSEVKSVIYRARDLLSQWLKKFKNFSYRCEDLEFTPGETYVPSKGHTSVRQKLLSLDHWTVTPEAADEAALLVWNTNALRKMAICHLTFLFPVIRDCHDWLHCSRRWLTSLVKKYLFTYVPGARASSVPKDNTKRRFINIEPMFNMLLQRCIASFLKSCLAHVGNNVESGQDDHRKMIKNLALATIDFSNASDSNHAEGTKFMFPERVFRELDLVRSHFCTFDGESVPVCKLSSMGNGFTFEVMTMYLLSLARVLDPKSRVYGDDVIIACDQAALFIECCETLGWIVNHTKTFTEGNFRESCGAFYHATAGYITSYKLEFALTIDDVITTTNKLFRLKHILPEIECAWSQLIKIVPALLKGPVVRDHLTPWVQHPNFERSKRACDHSRTIWKQKRTLLMCAYAEAAWHKKPVGIGVVFSFKSYLVKQKSDTVRATVDIGWYLFSGRSSDDVLRGKGRWRPEKVVFFDDGSYCRLSKIRRLLVDDIKHAATNRSIRSNGMRDVVETYRLPAPACV